MTGGALAPNAQRPGALERLRVALAVVVLVAVPLVPGVVAAGSPLALLRLPVESVIVVLLLAALPWRRARLVAAIAFGVFVVAALLLAGLDAAFDYALDTHFDLSDWQQVGDGFGVVQDSIGAPTAIALVVLIAVLATGTGIALTWSALRVDTFVRVHRRRGTAVTSAVTVAWVVAALLGSQLVAGQPAAASASIDAVASATSQASQTLSAQANLPHQIATDPFARVPASDLLTKLRGKDVVFAFVESYGKVALTDPAISLGVKQVLSDGQSALTADGYLSQSAWLTSPTFGGVSWLAHSTLQSGLWIDKQSIYNDLLRSTRFTLSDAFNAAGWNTVSDIPSDTHPWSFGSSFYHYGTLLDTNSVGYHGPSFGYARIPDQYTWKYFDDHELAAPHDPVMAEIDLVSSHTPWAPLPQLLPWETIGDGSVYASQPAQGQSTSDVWKDPRLVQAAYGQSIQYSLGAMFSFLQASDDPNLVVIALGDHQPASIVSGKNASHDVPITIISKDPSVFDAIAGWNWHDGLTPAADDPPWKMSEFRDRFLTAYGNE